MPSIISRATCADAEGSLPCSNRHEYYKEAASTPGARRAGAAGRTSSLSAPTVRAARSCRRSSSTWAPTRAPAA
jgi:hypothetical protein